MNSLINEAITELKSFVNGGRNKEYRIPTKEELKRIIATIEFTEGFTDV